MGRRPKIDDAELLSALSDAFRELGYAGTSVAMLAEATGLRKASLYHRFPGGKEQMAREVLGAAQTWLEEKILRPLREPGSPRTRIAAMAENLDRFYCGGRQACLLNMLASPTLRNGPFAEPIKAAFEAWIAAMAGVVTDAGFDARTAEVRAEKAVAHLEGALVLSRGMRTTAPFRRALDCLACDLLE